jgi:HNH endonuclease
LPIQITPELWPKLSARIRVETEVYSDCWTWVGALNTNKRPTFTHRYRTELSYRLVYRIFIGAIPNDCDLHHACWNKLCVNPYHMELIHFREHHKLKGHKNFSKPLWML